jgi:nucleotide-binding universal stress UspA family protein
VLAVCAVEEGTPANVVANVVKRWGASIMILGKSRRGILSRLFGQRTVDKVVHRASCPVMVVNTEHEEQIL